MELIKLSASFSLSEFCKSNTAARLGIDMTPPPHVINNLQLLCSGFLQPLRDALDKPITITSGYRPLALNKRIGSKPTSAHILGFAADIQCDSMTPRDLAIFASSLKLPFDQIILEFDRWVHVAVGPKTRGQVLTITKRDGGTVTMKGIA